MPHPEPTSPIPAALPPPTEAKERPWLGSSPGTADADLPKVSPRYVFLLVLASLGTWMAYVAPMSYSLTIRLHQIAPGHAEYLGYLTGIGGVVSLVLNPFVGVLSDRTRSRLGRRRPYLIAGTLAGLAALLVLAVAPNVALLGAGWVLAVIGWQTVMAAITTLQADKLPEHQRGKVSGITGLAQMVASALGVAVATTLVGNNLLLLLVPGLIGLLLVLPLAVRPQDPDGRTITLPEDKIGIRLLFAKYLFDPRRHRDFAWNWLGRFVFYIGMTFNTTYLAFFLAQRLGVSVERIGGTITAISGAGVLATMLGALAGGILSDRLRRRRLFVLLSGLLFCVGALLMVSSPSFAVLVAGSALTSLALGMFSAVDQAVVLDVLPSRAEAGRFIGIVNYAQQIPHAVAPLAASVLLGIGAAGDEKNYSVLYLAGGALTLIGGLIVMVKVKGSR
ncbi:MFS transporter [Amycolatopsis balhimycina DSM 5908]|uniref:MFS transporter n=1 Tax=Amycolatopsis balhimycina DSM 5908 TaxID=1081091 RepID=A0A428WJI5_AMYBA|nr:MFS transporter [Amycolatopsis balhimycina]RSM43180.1 MFS transporter [Amycolatopsis balhimycina DSM 5908]